MKHRKDFFTSRLGFILSLMGIAVGAGNIWRFSRIVAENGGGSFLIPWLIFLFLWSIPLMISELALGKMTRSAPIKMMTQTAGSRYAWMGAFIALVTTSILFYYSVVVGWGFRYFFFSLFGGFNKTTDFGASWSTYTHSLQPLLFHILAIVCGCYVVYRGIAKGIEKTNNILIPMLLGMILIIFVRAVTLPGAGAGMAAFFTPHLSDLCQYKIWIEALTQNAWDTGAGWGLLLVYAGYARQKESITMNACTTAFANNAVSLLMGMLIFSAIYALHPLLGLDALTQGTGATGTGLTFIFLPELFKQLPGGPIVQSSFAALFFLSFAFAALSSMLSMLQLTAQAFKELGLSPHQSIITTGALALLLGAPSALSMTFFENQDWVWSLGLIVNGFFIAFAVTRYGASKLRREVINKSPKDPSLGRLYNFMIKVLIPLQAIVLIVWYFYQTIRDMYHTGWWNPLKVYSLGTVIFQWGVALVFFILLNKWLAKRSLSPETTMVTPTKV